MTVVVKSKDELVVPRSVRRQAGIKSGDRVEFKVSGGIINIIPELPTADDEYTPAQRRLLDARLAEARKGPYYGPFPTADEAIAFLGKEIRNRRRTARKTGASFSRSRTISTALKMSFLTRSSRGDVRDVRLLR